MLLNYKFISLNMSILQFLHNTKLILRFIFLFVVCSDFGDSVRNNNGSTYHPLKCGTQKTVMVRSPRIIGGTNARHGEWPWQVGIVQVDPRDGTFLDHHCGGVLIHKKWILTSAHCLIDPILKFVLPPSFWRVEVGKILLRNTLRTDLKIISEEESLNSRKNPNQDLNQDFNQDYQKERMKFKNNFAFEYFDNSKVERIIIHQDFHPKTWSHDLALVKFSISENDAKEFIPVCLPHPNSNFVDYSCSVSGWGRTSLDGPFSKKLNTISVTILNETQCKEAYKNIGIFSDHMICAGDLKGISGPCVGDSGSPLQCLDKETQQWVLSGITSWGYGCAKENYPAVYMKVVNYLQWINKTIHGS